MLSSRLASGAGRQQADDAVGDGAFVDHPADRRVVLAERRDPQHALGRGVGQRVAQRRVGIGKAVPGMCRPITSISIWLLFAVP